MNRVLPTLDGQRADLYILVYGAIAPSHQLSLWRSRQSCVGWYKIVPILPPMRNLFFF
ncbi:hypothetical protein [Microcoleus sp. BROC3]|uniref:hypothetical protein n=1 Tax=Microcoleus sp. BROC3 TaxID=3055323 RepID=UPI002FD73222